MATLNFGGAININFSEASHENFSTRTMPVDRPGEDGISLMVMGKGTRQITVRGRVIDTTRAALINLIDNIPRNKGNTLSIDGVQFENTRFVGGKVGPHAHARPNAGGGNEHTAEVSLDFVQLIPGHAND